MFAPALYSDFQPYSNFKTGGTVHFEIMVKTTT
jgi:hypothetical protein